MTDWTFGGMWPYSPRFFSTAEGRLHYIDEGPPTAPPVVLLHGNPTWSFLYRTCIKQLLDVGHRVIAVDHLGFGRSDVPEDAEAYRIARHAERLGRLLDALRLRRAVLVIHDWAGPVALPWAVRSPQAVSGLVVLNTFAPRLPGPIGSRGSLRALRGRVSGPFLVKRRNVPTEQFLFKAGTANPARWSEQVKAAYRAPHPTPQSRVPMLVFPREIPFREDHPVARKSRETAPLVAERFARRPVQIIWGMKDILFGSEVLEQWAHLLPHATFRHLERAGHFLQEDEPDLVASSISEFVAQAALSD